MLVMPSDHVITNEAAFHAATDALVPQVRDGWLAAYGINPSGPETGYGYIQMDAEIGAGVHDVKRFVEKPDAARAEAIASIERYFSENLEQRIGNVAAAGLLSFFVDEVGPSIYNQAVADVQERMQARVAELDIEVHEDEFGYWRKYDQATRKRR